MAVSGIIHDFSLADLIHLFENCNHVRNLLHLDVFIAGQQTMAISKQLQQKATTLNASVGKAIAALVLLMFGQSHACKLHHIETFVCCVIESWVILEQTSVDSAAASYAFVAALSSYDYAKKDLVGAFTRGVKSGIETIEFFAKRQATRRRTT